MSERANFGDPSFEPTDEQLVELSREAFAEVPALLRRAENELRAEIARLRTEAKSRVAARLIGATLTATSSR
jgi:hypothetical protein